MSPPTRRYRHHMLILATTMGLPGACKVSTLVIGYMNITCYYATINIAPAGVALSKETVDITNGLL